MIPTLSPWRIGPLSVIDTEMKRERSPRRAPQEDTGVSYFMAPESQPFFALGSMPEPTATIKESGTGATFGIEGKSTIPTGDGGHGRDTQAHKVAIAVIELDAKLEWVAVPKQQACAFLRVSKLRSS